MSEILAAYETLMDQSSRGTGSSRVALACEALTLDELKRTFNVFKIRVLIQQDAEENDAAAATVNHDDDDVNQENSIATHETTANGAVSDSILWTITAHEDDSVTDLKQSLQQQFGREWGLHRRRMDRYGLATGWELLQGDVVLGNHLFLWHTYRIHHGDCIHAIIERP